MATTLDLEKLKQGWTSALGKTAAQIGQRTTGTGGGTQKKAAGGTPKDKTTTGGTASRDDYPVTMVYDKDHDYMADMQKYADQGLYSDAARAEAQRNSKITAEGLDPSLYTNYYSQYLPENRYTYDPTKNPEYTKYAGMQDELFQKIMGAEPYQQDPRVGEMFDKYMNFGDFKYNAEADPLYQQYRDQYTTLGQQAMRDTMGQAAGLTGGYGSTYSQAAGQQAYNAYLQRLNDVMPELYNAAYGRWQDRRNALAQQYQMALGMDETAYNRWLQEQGMLQDQYNMVNAQRENAYNTDYTNWANQLNLQREDEENARSRALNAEQTEYERQQNERSYLAGLISSTGYVPTDAELKAAGMTRAEADSLKAAYLQAVYASNNSGSGGGSGSGRRSGSRRSSGGGGGYPDYTPDTGPTAEEAYQQTVQQCYNSLEQSVHYGASRAQLFEQVSKWYESGLITEATLNEMILKYGLNKTNSGSKDKLTDGRQKA